MIRRPDIHPDDLAARQAIGKKLRAARLAEGVSAYEVSARLGLSRTAAQDLERTTEWAVRRIQAWSRVLAHRFTMTITGLAIPDVYDLRADLFAVATTYGAVDEDRVHLLTVLNDLVRVREATGVTYRQMADRLGVTERAIPSREDNPFGSQVRSVQQYCRALGGALLLDAAPVSVGVLQ